MRIRYALVALVALVPLAGTAACGGDDSGTAEATTTSTMPDSKFEDMTGQAAVEIKAEDNSFTPQYVKVTKGTTITFVNDGRNTHNVLSVKDGAFGPVQADAFEPGAKVPVTFDRAGDFPYYCSLHGTATKGMFGAVRVVD